jgi:hypothetical protein
LFGQLFGNVPKHILSVTGWRQQLRPAWVDQAGDRFFLALVRRFVAWLRPSGNPAF